jgi:predicted nucleotide-binding protein (sugar kinase/HSP70/actin superfamily)
LPRWFARTPSAAPAPPPSRARLRIGIPRVLNLWSTHQFWYGFFAALGIDQRNLIFSSDTSEEQGRQFGKGRGTVDCCYPVKCISGHYGELVFGQKRKLDLLFSPMIYNLPSFLSGHVARTLTCPRVMAAPENIKAGFSKEKDAFAEAGIRYVSPFACARADKPCIMVLARPYHMDPGIGHEIEVDLQANGYPILWAQYFPTDPDLLEWAFRDDLQKGIIKSVFDIKDVWPSSYSSNTNEILWGAKVAARIPWVSCVVRLASYECGMDQPTYTPVQQIVERSGTLFFSFQDLDSTKPAGSVKIRVETIAHYLGGHARGIIERKRSARPAGCPLLPAVA